MVSFYYYKFFAMPLAFAYGVCPPESRAESHPSLQEEHGIAHGIEGRAVDDNPVVLLRGFIQKLRQAASGKQFRRRVGSGGRQQQLQGRDGGRDNRLGEGYAAREHV